MALIRVRTGGAEVEVADEATLAELRRNGLLADDAERWVNGAWRPLDGARPRAEGGVPDPWAAWSDIDERDAEALLEKVTARADEEPAELPLAAVAPMPRAIVVTPRPVDRAARSATPASAPPPAPVVRQPAAPAGPPLMRVVRPEAPPALPLDAIEPIGPAPAPPPRSDPPRFDPPRSDPPRSDPPRSDPPFRPSLSTPVTPLDTGELIDFPRRPPRTPPPRPAAADSPPPLVRPTRVFAMIGAAVLMLGGLWAVQAMTHPAIPPVASVGARAPEAPPDPLLATEKRLRAVGLGAAHAVRKPTDLADATLVELQQLGLSVVSVEAPVTRWTGRKGDTPAAAEFHVRFHPSADLNYDLGAVLLVAGRYKLRYALDVSVIEAIAEDADGARGTTLDAARGEAFAKGRLGLGPALGLDSAAR